MEIQYVFELAGTAFFAISGALRATQRERPEWLGVSFVGFITAIGGGSLRDLLLGSHPLVWVGDVHFLHAILIGIVIARLFYPLFARIPRTLFLFDTLGLALFTVLGTEKALALGVDPAIAILMGMFSAVMGGVIRDVLTQREPILFSKEVYAMACVAGAGAYVLLDSADCGRNLSFCLAGGSIVAIRIAATRYHLAMPPFPSTTEQAVPLTPVITTKWRAGRAPWKVKTPGPPPLQRSRLVRSLLGDMLGLLNLALSVVLSSKALPGLGPLPATTLSLLAIVIAVTIAYRMRLRSPIPVLARTVWNVALGFALISLLSLTAPAVQWLGYVALGALATGHVMHLVRTTKLLRARGKRRKE